MLKKLPRLNSDGAAERFIDTADLSEYDLSSMTMVRFEFRPKTERVNTLLPRSLLDGREAICEASDNAQPALHSAGA